MYGFALLRFQLLVDKEEVTFPELKVTKAELVEEFKEVLCVCVCDVSLCRYKICSIGSYT